MSIYEPGLNTRMPKPASTRGSPYVRLLALQHKALAEGDAGHVGRLIAHLEACPGRTLGPASLALLGQIEAAHSAQEPATDERKATPWAT